MIIKYIINGLFRLILTHSCFDMLRSANQKIDASRSKIRGAVYEEFLIKWSSVIPFYGTQTSQLIDRVRTASLVIRYQKVHFRVCFVVEEKYILLLSSISMIRLKNECNACWCLCHRPGHCVRSRVPCWVQLPTKRLRLLEPQDSRWPCWCSLRRYWWRGSTRVKI